MIERRKHHALSKMPHERVERRRLASVVTKPNAKGRIEGSAGTSTSTASNA